MKTRYVNCKCCNERMFQQFLDDKSGRWLIVKGTMPPYKRDIRGRYFECPNPNCRAQYDPDDPENAIETILTATLARWTALLARWTALLAGWTALLVSLACFVGSFGLVVYQIYKWLRFGKWDSFDMLQMLSFMGSKFSVNLWVWVEHPETWIGLHKIMNFLPFSVFLVSLGVSLFYLSVFWFDEANHTNI